MYTAKRMGGISKAKLDAMDKVVNRAKAVGRMVRNPFTLSFTHTHTNHFLFFQNANDFPGFNPSRMSPASSSSSDGVKTLDKLFKTVDVANEIMDDVGNTKDAKVFDDAGDSSSCPSD